MSVYKERIEAILNIACPNTGRYSVNYKNVFGAVGGYINDRIFCSCGQFGFALKLPQKELDNLFDEGAQPLRYFPNGHVKKDYAVLTESMLNDREKMHDLIEESIRFSTPDSSKGERP